MNITPVKIDCKNLRCERQRENNKIMFHALITRDQVLVKHLCNLNELNRVLVELTDVFMRQISLEYLLYYCSINHMYAMTLAGRISKCASRQGTKDEAYILNKCNETVSQVGITIDNLTTTAFRPTKNGRILNKTQFENSGLMKSDCLKSFDARITGKVNGWVFAKVAFGSGGHQDNVFIEALEFGEWVKKYGNKSELHVILIDTDQVWQFRELREKCNHPNILVCDHVELQNFLLYWGMRL